jgi:hypothetical protein
MNEGNPTASPERAPPTAQTGFTRPEVLDHPDPPYLEPSEEELRISARLVLHLASQPRLSPGESGLESVTQAGIALALRSTQAAVSHALRRLADGGLLRPESRHVPGRRRMVKAYQLTPEGEALALHIRKGMVHPGVGKALPPSSPE